MRSTPRRVSDPSTSRRMDSGLRLRFGSSKGLARSRIVLQWNRERPGLDVSVTNVLQRISRIYLLQSASFAAVFDRYGITFGEFEVLAALLRSGPPYQMSPTRLVDALVLSSAR
jgi:hypothetical protein